MVQNSWVWDLAGAAVRHGAKVIPGVGRAVEVIEDVKSRRESAQRHVEIVGSISTVEARIGEVVRSIMQESFDKLCQANQPHPEIEQAFRNLQEIRSFGKHEIFAAEALFANSSHYELFKKAPQDWGDVLSDHDLLTPDGFYVFLDADKTRLIRLKPMMFRMLLADQKRGAPDVKLVGTHDLFAQRVVTPASTAPVPKRSTSVARLANFLTKQGVPPGYDMTHRKAIAGDVAAMHLLGSWCDSRHPDCSRANDVEALQWYTRAANAGEPKSMYRLGLMYADGRGTQRDDVEAVRWYRKAADAGNAIAMNAIGAAYSTGKGVTRDDAEAVSWCRKGAEAGYSLAMANLGLWYVKGQGVPQDDTEAVRWCRKAIEANNTYGMCLLGWMYSRGRGVPHDDAEAVRWYRKSADAGDPYGMFQLGLMYSRGRGVSQDIPEAQRLYRKAADAGNPRAAVSVGWMHETGGGAPRDFAEALRWYRKAADADDTRGMWSLGRMYQEGRGVPKDQAEALRWYLKSAEAGDPVSMYDLALIYAIGVIVPKDVAEALRWFHKSAEAGEVKAMCLLGWSYVLGRPELAMDWNKGLELLQRASALGHELSSRRLEMMKPHDQPRKLLDLPQNPASNLTFPPVESVEVRSDAPDMPLSQLDSAPNSADVS